MIELKSSDFKPYIIIFSVVLCLYLPAILGFSGFFFDDFYIFSIIHENFRDHHNIFFTNKFYLSARPIPSLVFNLYYLLFSTNSLMMKLVSLLLYTATCGLVYNTILLVCRVLNKNISEYLAILFTIAFIVHPNNIGAVLWIANLTELLMFFFYLVSFNLFLRYLLNEPANKSMLLFSLIAFLFSILSKQQSLHLPLLFFFFIFIKGNSAVHISPFLKRMLIVFFLLMISITLYNFLNFRNQSTETLSQFWKKPFSAVGIYLVVIAPFVGNVIYIYFLKSKVVAAILFLVIIAVLFYSSSKVKKTKSLILLLVFGLIILLPRMMGDGLENINSIMVFWLAVLGVLTFSSFSRKVNYSLLSIIVGFYLTISLLSYKYNWVNEASLRENLTLKLSREYKSRNKVIIASIFDKELPYESYFQLNHKWGKDSTIILSGLNVERISAIQTKPLMLEGTLNKDICSLTVISHDAYFYYNSSNIHPIKLTPSEFGRGCKEMTFNPPHDFSPLDPIYLVQNDSLWKQL